MDRRRTGRNGLTTGFTLLILLHMVPRVLFAERISLDRATSSSIEKQHAALTRHAEERGVEVVDKAVDRSVSGGLDMFKRPELKKWLTEEGRSKWDELWVTTQDRLSRNDIHFLAFVFKMIEWGKVLVVLDDPSLDLHSHEGRLIAHAKALTPAKELERIQTRVKESHEFRRDTPAWQGGIPPYGYTTVNDHVTTSDGVRKIRRVLALDEHSSTVLHEIRRWLVDENETLQGAALKLNARGEPTVKDLWRKIRNEKTFGERWSASGLLRTLRSEACLGIKQSKGKSLHQADGSPLIVADPVFSSAEWSDLQAAVEGRKNKPARKHGASPLLGIAFCGKCKGSAYRVVISKSRAGEDRTYKYYRCSKGHGGEKRCVGVNMYAEAAEEIVEDTFLWIKGDKPVTKRVFVPALDNTEELAELRKRINRLREDRELGVYDDDAQYYADTMKKYNARIKELEQLPQREAKWVDEQTDVTYKQIWGDSDASARRQLLIDAGVRLEINAQNDYHVYVPEEETVET